MKYKLYYKEIELGYISYLDQDFPNLFGKYKLTSPLTKDIDQYINYSIESNRLMITSKSKWLEFINENGDKFHDLIESEDWKLIDEDGEAHLILVPNFCANNEIVWRWG